MVLFKSPNELDMKFEDVLRKQILVLDGAMGTMVQNLELDDTAFGGKAFKMLTDLLVFRDLMTWKGFI